MRWDGRALQLLSTLLAHCNLPSLLSHQGCAHAFTTQVPATPPQRKPLQTSSFVVAQHTLCPLCVIVSRSAAGPGLCAARRQLSQQVSTNPTAPCPLHTPGRNGLGSLDAVHSTLQQLAYTQVHPKSASGV